MDKVDPVSYTHLFLTECNNIIFYIFGILGIGYRNKTIGRDKTEENINNGYFLDVYKRQAQIKLLTNHL